MVVVATGGQERCGGRRSAHPLVKNPSTLVACRSGSGCGSGGWDESDNVTLVGQWKVVVVMFMKLVKSRRTLMLVARRVPQD